ncbi:MAG: type VI secretion system baseplate subunit TssG [Gammaproteobacteria bacterium]|nr:type VI secretion system baseplate subunit TssG [Gammaproteobacteria bacterium]
MGININFLALAKNYENNKKIKFYASPELSFPVSDIASYDEVSGVVVLRFMGLLGVDSPLPYYLSKHTDLLQPLSHFLYTLFYQAINKPVQFSGYINYFKDCNSNSRENVLKLFCEKFSGIKVDIAEFVPQWIELNTNSKVLGEVVLGQRLLANTVKVIIPRYEDRVVIGQWIMR